MNKICFQEVLRHLCCMGYIEFLTMMEFEDNEYTKEKFQIMTKNPVKYISSLDSHNLELLFDHLIGWYKLYKAE